MKTDHAEKPAREFILQLTPSEKAHLEILRLSSLPELMQDYPLGGSISPQAVAQNERRAKEYIHRKFAIIKKYDVADEYLAPLREKEQELEEELTDIREQITGLEATKEK